MRYIFFILFSISVFAQKNPLEIKIDAITFTDTITHRVYNQEGKPFTTDTINARKFAIKYRIINLTEEPVRFVNELAGVSEKLYENQDYLGRGFMRNECGYYNGYFSFGPPLENSQFTSETGFHNEIEDVRNSILTLNPKQELKLIEVFYWEKKGHLSLYMERQPNFIELQLELKKDQSNCYFTPEELKAQSKDPNFIFGTFTSNKFGINFKE
ncbi:MAG: hypothetical protein ACI7YS_02475 [Flavobacterium sp.]